MVASTMEQCGTEIRHALEKPVEMAKEYPVASMMVLFGVGLGVGVLLGQSCSRLPYFAPEQSTTERLTKQIYDAVANAIPSSLAHQFHR